MLMGIGISSRKVFGMRCGSMRHAKRLAVLVVAIVASGVGATSAQATEGRDRAHGYIALGDSVAFGFSPLLTDPWVPEQFVGYPEIIGRRTGWPVTNLACPGQTAQALVSLTAVDNGCFDARAQASQAGFSLLHTDYPGTQLAAVLSAVRSSTQPSLISVQGGGNEVVICELSGVPDPQQCMNEYMPRVAASLRRVVTQLRGAGYRGRIVLVSYYLVPGLEAPLRRLNETIARTASAEDVAFADASARFDAYARNHGGDLCTAQLLIALPDGSCDLHPTRTGQELLADSVLAAARRSS
jgi:lysophospholipase L1-like esterase